MVVVCFRVGQNSLFFVQEVEVVVVIVVVESLAALVIIAFFQLTFRQSWASGWSSLGVVKRAVVVLWCCSWQTSIAVEHHISLVVLLEEVKFEGVAVFGGVVAVFAAELVDVCVGLHVAVQHRLVHTTVVALGALVRFRTDVNPDVVLQMMF